MTHRTGLGTDVHPLVAGRPLVLGGYSVPFEMGLDGHSDGDVLVHAVIDALLGAAALGDIGSHFPSSDPRNAGISSIVLLKRTVEKVQSAGWMATLSMLQSSPNAQLSRLILGALKPVLRPGCR